MDYAIEERRNKIWRWLHRTIDDGKSWKRLEVEKNGRDAIDIKLLIECVQNGYEANEIEFQFFHMMQITLDANWTDFMAALIIFDSLLRLLRPLPQQSPRWFDSCSYEMLFYCIFESNNLVDLLQIADTYAIHKRLSKSQNLFTMKRQRKRKIERERAINSSNFNDKIKWIQFSCNSNYFLP